MFSITAWKNPHQYKYNTIEYWRDRAKYYQYEYLMYFTRTSAISNDKDKIEDWIIDNCDEEGLLEANEKWNKTDRKCVKFYDMLDKANSDRMGALLEHLWFSNKKENI